LGADSFSDRQQLLIELLEVMGNEEIRLLSGLLLPHLLAVRTEAEKLIPLGQLFGAPDSVPGMVTAQEAICYHPGAINEIYSQIDQKGQIGGRGKSRCIKSAIWSSLIPNPDDRLHQVSGILEASGIAHQINIGPLRRLLSEGVDEQSFGAVQIHCGQLQGRLGVQC
jgi:hypothetical protein